MSVSVVVACTNAVGSRAESKKTIKAAVLFLVILKAIP